MTDSPFLPNTKIQYAWDSTSLGYLKTCPRLYYYQMIEGWTTKEDPIHLRFGIEYHRALQDYDLSVAAGIKHDDAVFDVVRALMHRTGDWWDDDDVAEMRGSAKNKTRRSLVRTVIWAIDKHRSDGIKTFIKEDGTPAVELSFRFELDWAPISDPEYLYVLCGHIDKVGVLADELYPIDYKTTAYPPTSWFFNKFDPHNQMTLYAYAAKVVLHAPVKGVIIDAVKVDWDTSEFGRGITTRSQDQITEWLRDLRFWLTLSEQYAIANYWPMNDTACDMFGGCRFRQICSKSPAVRERFLEGSFVKLPEEERWNPLRSR
jgi:hypothetical protein